MPTCRYLYRVTASQVCGRMSTQILSKRSGARFDVLGLATQVASKELPSQDAEMAWQNTSSFPLCPGHRPGPTLLNNSEKHGIHHGFNPGCHLLGWDTVGGLKP